MWHPLRGQEHGVRPAARAREQAAPLHVDLIDVRALLPVDLDAHEVLVHERRDLRIREDLTLHDMAPVAGAVAHGEKDRLRLLPGSR